MTRLADLQFVSPGVNAFAQDVPNSGGVWFGDDGDYVNEFSNLSDEPVILTVWGPDGSWVNKIPPLITLSMAAGSSRNISFATGAVGAWAAIYSDTVLSMGQVGNTWGEYSFVSEGVVDVSREVLMSGHDMKIDNGGGCVADMNTCVFVCASGDSCWLEYELQNCQGQPGAQSGYSYGAPSGGCGGIGTMSNGQILRTTLS